MTFLLLFTLFAILAAFTNSALRKIEQLTLRVEELEHDAGYGNW